MARKALAQAAPVAPGVLLYTFRQWPLFEYLNESARIPEALHDRACYLHPVFSSHPSRLFERLPEPSLPPRVPRAGLRLNRAVGRFYYNDLLDALAGDRTWQGLMKFGFHASAGVDAAREAFAQDGFRVVEWDDWMRDGAAPWSDDELDALCARDPSRVDPWHPASERGADRHAALREGLTTRGMSKAWILAASLRACSDWPSFQVWVRTLATRLDANVERLNELQPRKERARAVAALFRELARPQDAMPRVRAGVQAWMQRQLRVPAMQPLLAPSAALFGL